MSQSKWKNIKESVEATEYAIMYSNDNCIKLMFMNFETVSVFAFLLIILLILLNTFVNNFITNNINVPFLFSQSIQDNRLELSKPFF